MPQHAIPPWQRRFARRMRHDQTDAESLLWWRLRRNQLGVGFRRQHPIGRYIVDFACLERRLIVEADGSQHGGPKDEERDEFLRSVGFLVLRFWSWDVISDLEWVVYEIEKVLKIRVPGSSPTESCPGVPPLRPTPSVDSPPGESDPGKNPPPGRVIRKRQAEERSDEDDSGQQPSIPDQTASREE